MSDDYEIGYQKPPKHSQFRPGQSGNPRGRPKGSKNTSTLLQETLAETVTIREYGGKSEVTKLEAIFKQLVNSALKGDHRSMQKLLSLVMEQEALQKAETQQKQSLLPPQQKEETLNNLLERCKIVSGE